MNKKLQEKWDQLSPKHKHWALYGVLGVVLFIVANVFMSPQKLPATPTVRKKEADRTVFTDVNAKQLGIDALAGRIKELEDQKQHLEQRLDTVEQKEQGQVDQASRQAQDREAMKAQVRDEVLEEVQRSQPPAAPAPTTVNPFENPVETNPQNGKPYTFTQENPRGGTGTPQQSTPLPSGSGNSGSISAPAIRDINPDNQQTSGATPSAREAKLAANEPTSSDPTVGKDYIPAGAFLHSVLITGMEAPTGKKLQSDPYPALARVDTDTILPNFHRADMKQCFILANGLGDLSSERAYLRSTTLSCIRDDGGVIEVPIKAFAVGEDGKLGLRGRLVDKQGQMIGRALIAGVAEGFSSVFNRQAVPTIATTAAGSVQFQSQFSGSALESAGSAGFGKALDRVAQFYEDMAQNLFPVIEVDAERHCDWVLSAGLSLSNLKAVTNDTPLNPAQMANDPLAEPVVEPVTIKDVEASQRASMVNQSP